MGARTPLAFDENSNRKNLLKGFKKRLTSQLKEGVALCDIPVNIYLFIAGKKQYKHYDYDIIFEDLHSFEKSFGKKEIDDICENLREKLCREVPAAKSCKYCLNTKIGKECPVYSGLPNEVFQSCFESEYHDFFDNVKRALYFFEECSDEFEKNDQQYSRSCNVIQCSGIGKSRLIEQISINIPTFYICMRDIKDTGFPLETTSLLDTLGDTKFGTKLDVNPDFAVYFNCIALYIVCCRISCTIWKKLDLATDSASKEKVLSEFNFWQKQEAFWSFFKAHVKIEATQLYEKYGQKEMALLSVEQFIKNDASKGSPIMQDIGRKCGLGVGPSWLICIDEASNFKETPKNARWEYLMQLNRAARLLPKGSILIMMDTLSKINALEPKKIFPSERLISDGKFQKVYTDILCWNVAYIKNRPTLQKNGVLPRETVTSNFMALFGRPIWFNLNPDARQMLSKVKILFNKEFNLTDYSDSSYLAMLATCVDLDITSTLELSNNLSGSHMAHVAYCNLDNQTMKVNYPHDPILTEGSLKIFCNNKPLWKKSLEHLVKFIQSGIVHTGEKGELASQLLCIQAAALLEDRDRLLSINEFLLSLLGDEQFKEAKGLLSADKNNLVTEMVLENSFVNFNHFSRVLYTPNRADLVEYFYRRSAIVCKRNQAGVDLIIPFVLHEPMENGDVEPNCTEVDNGEIKPIKVKREQRASDLNRMEIPNMIEQLENYGIERNIQDDQEGNKTKSVNNSLEYKNNLTGNVSTEKRSSQSTKSETNREHKVSANLMSYILIQCKNYQNGYFTDNYFPKLCPYYSGIESSVSSDREKRPHIRLGLFYDKKQKVEVNEIFTRLEKNKDCVGSESPAKASWDFSVRNLHRRQSFFSDEEKLSQETSNVFDELLKTRNDAFDDATSGEKRTMKYVQDIGVTSTIIDCDRMKMNIPVVESSSSVVKTGSVVKTKNTSSQRSSSVSTGPRKRPTAVKEGGQTKITKTI